MPNTPPHPTGTKIGRFEILGFTLNASGGRVYLCKCECGNLRSVASGKLNAGRSKSCGCLRREMMGALKTRWGGNPATNSIIAQYRNAASKRSLVWELSHAQATHLLYEPCFWCGLPPSRQVMCRSHSAIVGGIDRRDNSLGYTAANSVSCCKTCNIAKASLTELEWLRWIDRLTLFRARNLS